MVFYKFALTNGRFCVMLSGDKKEVYYDFNV